VPQLPSPISWSDPRGPTARLPDKAEPFLIDPITAQERNIHHVPVDRLLDFTLADQVLHGIKTAFVTLPATVLKGLRGDQDVSLTDFGLMAKIPYYAAGLVLMGSFLAAGRKKVSAIRMGVGVLLYYVGVAVANTAVNTFYKLRYGIDLGLKYRRADGRIDQVFGSLDAPRFDLLTANHYAKARQKMGIPSNLADRDQACREQILRAIGSADALKIVLGVLLAGIGAGQIARTDAWAVLLNSTGAMGKIWKDPKLGSVFQRAKQMFHRASSIVDHILRERFLGNSHRGIQRASIWAALAVAAYGIYHSLNVVKPKNYQSSPVLPDNWSSSLQSNGVFREFIRNRNLEGMA
jgi:hypothetical protein